MKIEIRKLGILFAGFFFLISLNEFSLFNSKPSFDSIYIESLRLIRVPHMQDLGQFLEDERKNLVNLFKNFLDVKDVIDELFGQDMPYQAGEIAVEAVKSGHKEFILDVRRWIDKLFKQNEPYSAGRVAVKAVKSGHKEFIPDVRDWLDELLKQGQGMLSIYEAGRVAIEAVKSGHEEFVLNIRNAIDRLLRKEKKPYEAGKIAVKAVKSGHEEFVPDIRNAIDKLFKQNKPYSAGLVAVEAVKSGHKEFIPDVKDAVDELFLERLRKAGKIAVGAVKSGHKEFVPDIRNAIDKLFRQNRPYSAGLVAVEAVKSGHEEFVPDIRNAIDRLLRKERKPYKAGEIAVGAVKSGHEEFVPDVRDVIDRLLRKEKKPHLAGLIAAEVVKTGETTINSLDNILNQIGLSPREYSWAYGFITSAVLRNNLADIDERLTQQERNFLVNSDLSYSQKFLLGQLQELYPGNESNSNLLLSFIFNSNKDSISGLISLLSSKDTFLPIIANRLKSYPQATAQEQFAFLFCLEPLNSSDIDREEIISLLNNEDSRLFSLAISDRIKTSLWDRIKTNRDDISAQELLGRFLGILKMGGEFDGRVAYQKINDIFRLYSINFADAGNSSTSFGKILEGLLGNTKKINLTLNISIPELSVDIISDTSSIQDILEEADMEGAEFLKIQGRSIIFKKGNKYIKVKLMKNNEKYSDFIREMEVQLAIKENESELGLLSSLPLPLIKGGKAIFSFGKESLSQEIQGGLDKVIQEHKQVGKEFSLKEKRGKYVAIVDVIEDEGYFNYINNEELSDEEFLEASKKSMHDLMVLAEHGLFHTALADLFHNVTQRGRSDRGRYLWMTDIVRQMATRRGAGRLNAWQESVKYPNPRESGITDWEHIFSLNDIMNDEDVAPWLSSLGRFGEKAENFYVTSYLGDYLLTFALLTADRMFKRGELDWQNPDKLTHFLKEIFIQGYREFTGNEDIIEAINWERMAKQIAFFCSNAYVEYLNSNSDNRHIPEGIYGPETSIRFGDSREGTWDDEIGWSNEQGHRHLGPTNGPTPLQELIKSIYIMTGFMINEASP